MEHVPPPAEELALLDRELARLDARRLQLLSRRSWLVAVLRPPVAPLSPPPPGFRPAAAPFAWGPPRQAAPATGARGAQNVLLVLGGLLLAVAAIAFTLFSWGEMGIAGRSAVLTAVTAGALVAPAPLLGRRLSSTAEALAAVALVLTVLDAYALHAAVLPDTDGLGFAAASSVVLAVAWAAYGLGLGRLRLPLPAAVVMGQFPLVLWAWYADGPAVAFGWALLVTAAADVAVASRGGRLAVRVAAWSGAAVTGSVALLIGLVTSLPAGGAVAAAGPGALLLAGAVVALSAGWRAPREWAVAGGVVAGGAAVAGVGGVLRTGVPWSWAVVVYLLCGAALSAVVRLRAVPRPVVRGVLGASVAVTGAAVLVVLPVVAAVLLGPASLVTDVWSGAPEGVRGAVGASVRWPDAGPAPVVLLVSGALLGAVYAARGRAGGPRTGWWAAAGCGALGLGWAGAVVLPVVVDAPYAVAVVVGLLLVAGLSEVAVRRAPDAVAWTALGCALVGAVGAGLPALAAEPATYTVFGALVVLFAGVAVRSRVAAVRSVAAVASVLCALVVAGAVGASLGWSAPRAAVVVLVVPAVTVGLGLRLRGPAGAPSLPPSLSLSLEFAGAFGALVAVGLSVPDAPYLALVLGLCGVLAAATALRPERRPGAGYLAAGLFVAATWVRLGASGVADPEAYTLPVSVVACGVGFLRRRRDPEASSWVAYGPGLAVTLLPSLVTAWPDPHWPRPLLLGVAALVVTLVGARRRLQAPLVLGGSVLALDALHELAPHVVQVLDALPRWAFPALAGLLLLALGATYEQRLRDARRVRESLGRMR
ncbi:SCO7613 C-terminal domain-containing membrane protein [Streptomyces sp. NPDC058330]|uniref:SCO7613 C-terminal domain-containing membrane protein n=1 Tax=Streptomyces sp. NPDC058330 TaxID=3346449 RepID=UPI0036EE8D5B